MKETLSFGEDLSAPIKDPGPELKAEIKARIEEAVRKRMEKRDNPEKK